MLLLSSLAFALETTPYYGGEVDFNRQYLWRGLSLSTGPVINPTVWVGMGATEVGAWLNIPTNSTDYFEVDPYFFGSYAVGALTIEPGVTGYLYPGGGGTAEVSVGLSLPVVGPVSVFTTQVMDVVGAPGGWFGEFGVGYSQEIDEGTWTIEGDAKLALASAAYHAYNIGPSVTGLSMAGGGASATWYPLDFLYLRGHGELHALIGDGLADAYGQSALQWNLGLAAGLDF